MIVNKIVVGFACLTMLSSCGSSKNSTFDTSASHSQTSSDEQSHQSRRGEVSDSSTSSSESQSSSSEREIRQRKVSRIATPSDQVATVGASFSLQLEKARPNDDDLYLFTAEKLPAGLTIDANSGLISGVVSGEAGIFEVIVKAVEQHERPNHRSSIVTFKITVNK
ncbi:MAG: Ig domain-containing protein [Proteobacteria bacterium]|nr:Ig domain-containing protein [Pseudomonadota bacterium]